MFVVCVLGSAYRQRDARGLGAILAEVRGECAINQICNNNDHLIVASVRSDATVTPLLLCSSSISNVYQAK